VEVELQARAPSVGKMVGLVLLLATMGAILGRSPSPTSLPWTFLAAPALFALAVPIGRRIVLSLLAAGASVAGYLTTAGEAGWTEPHFVSQLSFVSFTVLCGVTIGHYLFWILTEVTRQRVRMEAPRVTVVILTMYPEDSFAASLIRQGAGAYIPKSGDPDELIRAIRVVASGGIYLTDKLREIEQTRGIASTLPHEKLSPREMQVFMSIIGGKTVSETAAEIDLAVSTVSTVVSRVRDKLEAGSVADLVRYAHRVGLLD
ncbi:MAG: response regulator transcription factor, partial [Deltaproteobacteria bacterium]|nr:response regulator transcription factor [Deltaproteobacteria bacterium]